MAPIGVALIGGGIFIKEYHLPAVQACSHLTLKAIYSRSLASAKATADLATSSSSSSGSPAPDLYSDDAGEGRSFDHLLARDDVAAVIIALPITLQIPFVEKALAAGKHVLAEKPIGPDVATARKLVDAYRSGGGGNGGTLAIAENFRFTPKWAYASQAIRGLGGKITGFQMKSWQFVRPGSKYIETSWRKTPTHQGGFVLDGGVHQTAALRFVLHGAAGEGNDAVASVSAHTALTQAHLPPIDSAVAALTLRSGAVGTLSLHYGSALSANTCEVSCDGGGVRVEGDTVTVTTLATDGTPRDEAKEFPPPESVKDEVQAWAEGLVSGKPNPLQSPEEALADLELIEALFRSGEQGGAPVKLQFQ